MFMIVYKTLWKL